MTRTTRTTRLLALALVAAVSASALAGCSAKRDAEKPAPAKEPTATTESAFPVTITDDAGREVTLEAEPESIVSLAPANTEMLFAIGAGGRVTGVTTYDDYPAEVKELPKVGDFVQPNMEAIAAAKPDLVVATTGVQADVLKKLEDLGATVVAIDPQSLDGVYEDITELGQVTGTSEAADKLVADMKADVASVTEAVKGREVRTTFVEIGQNPLFTVGAKTLIGELVTLAGGRNVVAQEGYVPYSLEQLVKDNPYVYLSTKGSMSDPEDIAVRPGYEQLAAVEQGRIYLLDDNLVSRPGPRIAEGLKQIAQGIHPEAFQ